jgi:HK97 family phage portal protein
LTFIDWLRTKFSGGAVPLSGAELHAYADEYAALSGDVYIREMALWSAINLVANAISKCEFKTFVNGEETKGREWYLWNIEPNKNQNSSAFIREWIAKLMIHNECLIVEQNGELLIADSFEHKEYALYNDVFSGVTVGDFTFSRFFNQSEVLYFRLHSKNMRAVTDGLYSSYSQLISYSMNAYRRSRGTKGVFKYESIPVAGSQEKVAFDALINEKIGKWLTSDNAALPLGKGQSWEEKSQKTYASESTRDIRAQIDDVSDFTAKAFGIPPALLRGDVAGTKDALEQFLTFCIIPLADTLEEEINRKRNGYVDVINGTRTKIDIRSIKHFDVLDMATSVEKLISSGCYSINEIREILGEERIDEPFADEHLLTKNIGALSGSGAQPAGGEKDG